MAGLQLPCVRTPLSAGRRDAALAWSAEGGSPQLQLPLPLSARRTRRGYLAPSFRVDAGRNSALTNFALFGSSQPGRQAFSGGGRQTPFPAVTRRRQALAPRLGRSGEHAETRASASPAELAALTMPRDVNANTHSGEGLVVTVCGGGNAAHVAAAMYAHHGAKVHMFLSLATEVQKWQEAALADGIRLHKKYEGETYVGRVASATSDPGLVIPESDLILIIVPAFAHRPILEAIGPHLKTGALILAMPAPGNFDLLARQVLGPKVNDVVLAGSVCLPWACRIEEYARKVELLGEKSPVTLVARPYSAIDQVIVRADRIHDASHFRPQKLFIQATLFPTNPMLHPGIMFSFWSRWDGKPLEARPLFYEGVDDFAASVLEGEDADLQATIRAVEAALGVPLPLPTLKEQMVEGYGDQIADPGSYKTMLASNSSLQGLYHPLVQDGDGKWLPDFKSRYLWEDIPHGLIAMKSVAQLMEVPTPTIDKVITWAQGVMGREYLVGDQLVGKDVGSTSATQAFGIATKEDFLTELKHQLEAVTPATAGSA